MKYKKEKYNNMSKEIKNKKISNFELIVRLIVKVKRDDIFALASQLSYYIVLSFFPLIIFLTSLIAMVNVVDSTEIINGMKSILPLSVFKLIQAIIIEVLGTKSASLVGGSMFVAVWMSSSGFRAVIKAINKAYNIQETRSVVKRTIIAYVSTIVFAVTILIALCVLVFGKIISKHIIEALPLGGAVVHLWDLLRYVIIVFILITIFASLYKFTPCKKFKWREVIPGAIVSTLGWIVSSYGFSVYINNFNNYSKFYGSLAAVFILMLWIFITSIIIIFGVEVNSVLSVRNSDTSKKSI